MFGPSQNSGPWRSSGKKATSAGIRTGPFEGSVAAPHVLTSSPAFGRWISRPSPTISRSTKCNWWVTMRCGSTGLPGTRPACIPGHCCEHCVPVQGARGEDRDLQTDRAGDLPPRTRSSLRVVLHDRAMGPVPLSRWNQVTVGQSLNTHAVSQRRCGTAVSRRRSSEGQKAKCLSTIASGPSSFRGALDIEPRRTGGRCETSKACRAQR